MGESVISSNGVKGFYFGPDNKAGKTAKDANNVYIARCKKSTDFSWFTGYCQSEFRNGTEMFPTDYGYSTAIRFTDSLSSYRYYIERADRSARVYTASFTQDLAQCGTWDGLPGYFVRINVWTTYCAWGGMKILHRWPHIDPGEYKFFYFEDSTQFLAQPINVVKGTLGIVSGSNQANGVVLQRAPEPVVVEMRNADGEVVNFPIDAEYPEETNTSIKFTLKHAPSAAGGLVTDMLGNANPDGDALSESIKNSDDSQFHARIKLGSDTGLYEVWAESKYAAAPAIATITAALRAESSETSEDVAADAVSDDERDAEGDPIFVASGNNVRREVDYAAVGISPLVFERTYVSGGAKSGLTKSKWNTTFDRRVVLPTASSPSAFVRRPNGQSIRFNPQGASWSSDPYQRAKLEKAGSTWKFTSPYQTVEAFDANGRLISITDLRGRSQTLAYSNKGLLTRVTANTGEYLDFTFNSFNQIATVKDHTTRTWTYSYDNLANLSSVRYPEGKFRYYDYESDFDPRLLTAVQLSGASNAPHPSLRYVNWEYDANGRATRSWFGQDGGIPIRDVRIAYSGDGSRTVTEGGGNVAVYQTVRSGNRTFISGRAGAQLTNVGPGNVDRVFDLSMNVTRETRNGVVTEFFGHDAKGQPGYRVVAPGTPQSRRTDFTFDPRFIGKPTSIIEPSVRAGQNRVTDIQYDAMGNATRISTSGFTPDGAPLSRVTTAQYAGPFGQISQIDGPRTDVSDITTFTYDPTSKRLLRVTDANGNIVRDAISWTRTGKIAAETRANGLRLTYTYETGTDLLASMREVGVGQNRTTTWTYTPRRQAETGSVDDGVTPLQTVRMVYNAAGDVTGMSNATGEYSVSGNQATPLSIGGSRATDNLGNATTETSPGRWLTRTFDQFNRVDRLIRANNEIDFDIAADGRVERIVDGKSQATTFAYDDLRRLTQVVEPGVATTSLGYDVHHHLTTVRDANNATTSYLYDDLGNLLRQTSPDSGTSTYVHDAAGNVTQTTDAQARVTTYTYDAGNRIKSANRVGTNDDDTFSYDTCVNGRRKLCSITRGNAENVSFEYDGSGRMTKQTNRIGNVSYLYSGGGRVTKITYPSGRSIGYSFDAAGRVTGVRLNDGTLSSLLAGQITHQNYAPITGWTYGNGVAHSRQFDAQGWPRAVNSGTASVESLTAFDGNGNPTALSVNNVARTFGYNARDELTAAIGPWGTHGYQYDVVGNRTQFTDDGITADYLYAPQSNRIDLSTPWDYTLDASGNMTHKERPDGSGYRFVFNSENRLTEARDLQSNALIASYAYNALGQRVAKTVGGNTTRFVFGLDGKLLAELSSTGVVQREYVWLNGLPLAVLGAPDGASPPTVTFDQTIDNAVLNTLPSCMGWTSKRDSAATGGNFLLGGNARTCGQDARWQASVPVAGAYDVFIKWMGTDASGAKLYWVDGTYIDLNTVGATKGAWIKLGTFQRQPGTLTVVLSDRFNYLTLRADAIRVVLTGQDAQDHSRVTYIHSDHLGTPLAMTDKNQRVIWRAEYEPFGQAALNTDPDNDGQHTTLNLRFPGQYADAETGLHYNYFRDYDPELGRYIESDPIGLAGGVNTFGYVGGNPVTDSDSFGLITDAEIRALADMINAHSKGPHVGPDDIVLDPTATRGLGHNDFGGPIILHTNPSEEGQYWGSVVERGMELQLLLTGVHENAHRGQSWIDHKLDAISELVSSGTWSDAQTQAEDELFNSGTNLLEDFRDRVRTHESLQ